MRNLYIIKKKILQDVKKHPNNKI